MTAQGLPCLNPTCTHTFAHNELKGAASLRCPKCGNVFQFGAAPAAPPKATRSQTPPPKAKPAIPKAKPAVPVAKAKKPAVAKPVAARPVVAQPVKAIPVKAQPVKAQPVKAQPVSTPTATPVRTPVPNVQSDQIDVEPVPPPRAPQAVPTAPHPQPRPQPSGGRHIVGTGHPGYSGGSGGNMLTRIIIVLGVISLLGAGGFFISQLIPENPNFVNEEAPPESKVFYGEITNTNGRNEDIFRVVVPKAAWELDLELRRQFKGAIAMSREVPSPDGGDPGVAWFAVAAHDYGTVEPRDSELMRQGIERLEDYFGDQVRMGEPKVGEFNNLRAQVMEFQGPGRNQVWWFGDMYTLTQRGIGYWIFIGGSGNLETAQSVFKELQETKGMGLYVRTDRKGWTAQPPPMSHFLAKGVPLKLSAPEKTWKRYPNAQAKDENGRLYLQSVRTLRNDPDKNIKAADLLLVSVDRATANLEEAMELAKEYVVTRKKAENENFKLVPASETSTNDLGTAKPVGEQLGRIGEWKLVNNDESFQKYLLVAVVREPDRIYIFQCESFWRYHDVWREEFYDILSTVKVLKE